MHVRELRVPREERERDVADGPVAVLGDDQIGFAGALGLGLVVLLSVQEHHEVCVLLDRTRLS